MQEQLSGGQQLVPTGLKNFAPVCSDLKISSSICAILLKSAHQRVGTFFYERMLFRYTQKKRWFLQHFSPLAQFARVFSIKKIVSFLLFCSGNNFFAMFFNPYSVCESAADWAKLATRIRAWGVCPRLRQRVDIFFKSLAINYSTFSNHWHYHSTFFNNQCSRLNHCDVHVLRHWKEP